METTKPTYEKVSDTEIKVTTVIPEKVEEVVVNMDEVKSQVEAEQAEIDRLTTAQAGDDQRYADAIAPHQAKVDELTATMSQADSIGVKPTPIKEEPPVDTLPIEEPPMKEVPPTEEQIIP